MSYWLEFITKKFEKAGKRITPQQIEQICETVQYHSSYVQQLCWYIFLESSDEVTADAINVGVEELICQNTPLFETWTESLSAYQMRLLTAVADGIHEGLSAVDVIRKYRLVSSANVVAVKKSLLDKNLIYADDKKVYLTDPVMGMWLRR